MYDRRKHADGHVDTTDAPIDAAMRAVSSARAPLVRDGAYPIKVIAERKEGFNGAINVRMITRPTGLSCSSSINIPAGSNEVTYNFSANGSAEIKLHQIAMLGTSSVKGGSA